MFVDCLPVLLSQSQDAITDFLVGYELDDPDAIETAKAQVPVFSVAALPDTETEAQEVDTRRRGRTASQASQSSSDGFEDASFDGWDGELGIGVDVDVAGSVDADSNGLDVCGDERKPDAWSLIQAKIEQLILQCWNHSVLANCRGHLMEKVLSKIGIAMVSLQQHPHVFPPSDFGRIHTHVLDLCHAQLLLFPACGPTFVPLSLSLLHLPELTALTPCAPTTATVSESALSISLLSALIEGLNHQKPSAASTTAEPGRMAEAAKEETCFWLYSVLYRLLPWLAARLAVVMRDIQVQARKQAASIKLAAHANEQAKQRASARACGEVKSLFALIRFMALQQPAAVSDELLRTGMVRGLVRVAVPSPAGSTFVPGVLAHLAHAARGVLLLLSSFSPRPVATFLRKQKAFVAMLTSEEVSDPERVLWRIWMELAAPKAKKSSAMTKATTLASTHSIKARSEVKDTPQAGVIANDNKQGGTNIIDSGKDSDEAQPSPGKPTGRSEGNDGSDTRGECEATNKHSSGSGEVEDTDGKLGKGARKSKKGKRSKKRARRGRSKKGRSKQSGRGDTKGVLQKEKEARQNEEGGNEMQECEEAGRESREEEELDKRVRCEKLETGTLGGGAASEGGSEGCVRACELLRLVIDDALSEMKAFPPAVYQAPAGSPASPSPASQPGSAPAPLPSAENVATNVHALHLNLLPLSIVLQGVALPHARCPGRTLAVDILTQLQRVDAPITTLLSTARRLLPTTPTKAARDKDRSVAECYVQDHRAPETERVVQREDAGVDSGTKTGVEDGDTMTRRRKNVNVDAPAIESNTELETETETTQIQPQDPVELEQVRLQREREDKLAARLRGVVALSLQMKLHLKTVLSPRHKND